MKSNICFTVISLPIYSAPYQRHNATFMQQGIRPRNLNPGQWACIAVAADELLAAIREQVERERREKIAENNGMKEKEATAQLIAPSLTKAEKETAAKAAQLFNTNRTYIHDAARLKESAPDMFSLAQSETLTTGILTHARGMLAPLPPCRP